MRTEATTQEKIECYLSECQTRNEKKIGVQREHEADQCATYIRTITVLSRI